jgi:hypothetical protein
MTNIANAINQNAITTNTTLAIQQSAKKAVHLRREEITTLGATAASAASAGVRGRSVNATILDVKRNAGLIEKQRTDDLRQVFLQEKQQRLGSTLSAVQNQDLTYLPKPKFSNYLAGAMISSAKQAVGALSGGMGGGGGSSTLGSQTIEARDYLSSNARQDIQYMNSGGLGPYRF